MSILAPSPTSVYRYYDAGNVLLYVGITSRRTSRQAEHNADKEWWPFVRRQSVDHFPTRQEASAREKTLIRQYRPPFNKQHNPDHESMRALYLASTLAGQGHKALSRATAESAMPKEARQILTSLGHRLPLQRLHYGDDRTVTYQTRAAHAALAKEVSWPERVTIKNPKEIAELRAVEHAESVCLLTFEITAKHKKMPAQLHLKLRSRRDPVGLYALEAVIA